MESVQPSPDNELIQILRSNGVHENWISIFNTNSELVSSLNRFLELDLNKSIPVKDNIFRALLCPPENIKVVILGHNPISDASLATGLSFSFPKGTTFIDKNVGNDRRALHEKGRSIAIIHDALVRVGILERGGTYDYNHDDWVERGVLLLNASLTYGSRNEPDHFEIWQTFINKLVLLVAQLTKEERLFFLCWGTDANVVGKCLFKELNASKYPVQLITYDDLPDRVDDIIKRSSIDEETDKVIFAGHHPTWPRGEDNMFIYQAMLQFEAVTKYYPGLLALPKLETDRLTVFE